MNFESLGFQELSFNTSLSVSETQAIDFLEEIFKEAREERRASDESLGTLTSFVQNGEQMKIVSCRKPNIDILYKMEDFLDDYGAYLDYLYGLRVEEVHSFLIKNSIFPSSIKSVELLLKTMAIAHNMGVHSNEKGLLVLENDKNYLVASSKMLRGTFDEHHIYRIKWAYSDRKTQQNNLETVHQIALNLKRLPRPGMSVTEL